MIFANLVVWSLIIWALFRLLRFSIILGLTAGLVLVLLAL